MGKFLNMQNIVEILLKTKIIKKTRTPEDSLEDLIWINYFQNKDGWRTERPEVERY